MSELWYHSSSPAGLIDVYGEDASTFLQGQGSQDLAGAAGSCRYTLWLDHKGRVHGDSFVLQVEEERYRLVSAFSPSTSLKAKFDAFIVADDVETAIVPDYFLLTLGGRGASGFLQHLGAQPPQQGHYANLTLHGGEAEAQVFQGRRGKSATFEILLPEGALADLIKITQQQGGTVRSSEDLERMRITAGIPAIPIDIGPGETPLEGGLEDAVSLRKGCFLGQEVVARQTRLGRITRTLVITTVETHLDPETMYPVFSDGKEVGSIRSSVHQDSGTIALALVKTSSVGKELVVAASNGMHYPVRILPRDG